MNEDQPEGPNIDYTTPSKTLSPKTVWDSRD
jgi:hypothetical protein